MRYRVKTDTEQQATYHVDFYKRDTGSLWLSKDYFNEIVQKEFESMNDVVVPHFYSRRASGEIFNNFMDVRTYSVMEKVDQYTQTSSTDRAVLSGPLTSGAIHFLPIDGWINDDYAMFEEYVLGKTNLAIIRAMEDIDKTPYAMMEDVLEAASTARTLRKPLRSALNTANKFQVRLKKKRSAYLRRGLHPLTASIQAASDIWLSSMYELRPLVYLSSQVASQFSSKRARPKRIKMYAREDGVWNTQHVQENSSWKLQIQNSARSASKGYGLYTVENPLDDWRFDFGVRNKDIPRGLWAVMPYSWLSDRFVNLGSRVSALTNLLDPSITILSSGFMTRWEFERTYIGTHKAFNGWSGFGTGNPRVEKFSYAVRCPKSFVLGDLLKGDTAKAAIVEGLSDISTVLDMCSLIGTRLNPFYGTAYAKNRVLRDSLPSGKSFTN